MIERKLRKNVDRIVDARRCKGLAVICSMLMLAAIGASLVAFVNAEVLPQTKTYDDITENGYYVLDPEDGCWDAVIGDLVISYTLDMSGYVPPMWATAWSSVGVGGGASGWMASGAPAAAVTDPNSQDMDDKLNLGAPDRYDESSYDATGPETIVSPPIGNPQSNYGVWFDRDGVDPYQALMWGMVDGVTYNTGGIYDVELTIHAVSDTLGTMFATVNGVQTGFYDSWKNAQPDHYPVGKSISGDLRSLRVFASVWGLNVNVLDLEVVGYKPPTLDIKPGSDINPLNLGAKGLLPVAVMGSEWFDVSTIDQDSVLLKGAPSDEGIAPARCIVEDVDADGFLDSLYLFETTSVATLTMDDEYLSLEFFTDGQSVLLDDFVKLVGKSS
jgi:hypothetical protein